MVGDVECLDDDATVGVGCGDLGGELGEAVRTTRAQGEVVAPRGELAGHLRAEPAAGAGNDNDLVLNSSRHDLLLGSDWNGSGARARPRGEQGRAGEQTGGEQEGAPPADVVEQHATGESAACDCELDEGNLQAASGFEVVGDDLGHPRAPRRRRRRG